MTRGEQFFHGSSHDIPVGGKVLPGNSIGKSNWDMETNHGDAVSAHAFATTDEHVAWGFASGNGVSGMDEAGRDRVYEVHPHHAMRTGLYNARHRPTKGDPPSMSGRMDLKEYVAPSFKVKGVINTKPGNQGTFPSLNWNQFRGPEANGWGDMNHPDADEERYGHGGSEMRKAFNLVEAARLTSAHPDYPTLRTARNMKARREQTQQPELPL